MNYANQVKKQPKQKQATAPIKALAVGIMGLASISGLLGARLFIGSFLLAFSISGDVDEGGRAFFMNVSGLGLLVFTAGFIMMLRQLAQHYALFSPRRTAT